MFLFDASLFMFYRRPSIFFSFSLFLFLSLARDRVEVAYVFPTSHIMYPGFVKQAYHHHRYRQPKSFSAVPLPQNLFLPLLRTTSTGYASETKRKEKPPLTGGDPPAFFLPPTTLYPARSLSSFRCCHPPFDSIPLKSLTFLSVEAKVPLVARRRHSVTGALLTTVPRFGANLDVFRSLLHSFHVSFSKRALQDCTRATSVFASPRRE